MAVVRVEDAFDTFQEFKEIMKQSDGSAEGGQFLGSNVDFISSVGFLYFKPLEEYKDITIEVNQNVKEYKNFIVSLRNPSLGALIGARNVAVCHFNYSIVDDVDFCKDLKTKFEKFYKSNPSADVTDFGSDVFNFNYPRRGLAIIFANSIFYNKDGDDLKDLECIEHFCEATRLKETLEEYEGFDVLLCDDYSADRMELTAQKAAEFYRHQDADCFVCIIMTHGNKDRVFGSCIDSKPLPINSIVSCFNDENCKSLKNKPRLFFIQACRGIKEDKGVTAKFQGSSQDSLNGGATAAPKGKTKTYANPQASVVQATEENDEIISESIRPVQMYPDCMIMYSTPPGFKAYGKWKGPFMQRLNFAFSEEKKESESFLKILTRQISGILALYNFEKEVEDVNGEKQTKIVKLMPVIDSMLRKDIIMSKKKYSQKKLESEQ